MKHLIIGGFLAAAGALQLPSAVADEVTTLVEMLAKVRVDADVSMDTRPLARDWIGDITGEDGKIVRIRLEKGRIRKGEVALLRTYPNGQYLGSDAPLYVKSIPSNEKLRSCVTVADLQGLLGTGQQGFSGSQVPEGIHGAHWWVCFSPSAVDRLTYISVFAHTFFKEGQGAQGITQVNELLIQRGELQPADPDNKSERDIYLSGADRFAIEEAEKEQKRQRYSQPLRDLILATEHPNDPDLKHLAAAIQAIRETPDPKLFAQLVQEMHERTLKVRILLNHILLNHYNILDLSAWGAKEEAIAINACIDSLPLAKDREARDTLIEDLLHVCGGGKIEIQDTNGGSSIEVVPFGGGYRVTIGGVSNPLPLVEVQEELRRLYTKSRSDTGSSED